ncbi:UDP-Glycosyltransferase/glycogen phosphorylase [Neoconidiobolus thromboides FSU 785]|nr:UDP-Glycosyltransferase/glycogen phosphorylase [Neoconidiobolus thromboides FSU 785]
MINTLLLLPYIIPVLLAPYVLYLKLKKYVRKGFIENRRVILQNTKPNIEQLPPFILGYFHPFCNDGGGGERVLWAMIEALQNKYPNLVHVIYTGDDIEREELVEKVKTNFNIKINVDTLYLIHLTKRNWVEAKNYPRFTMLLQSLASTVLGWEAMSKLIPDLFFDTMGYAFTYPLVSNLVDCKIAAYVHYPTISTDMISSIQQRDDDVVNNSSAISNSSVLSNLKLIYYKFFAFLYSWCGSFSNLTMVNSSWTKGHIDSLWGIQSNILYPPCSTIEFNQLSLKDRNPNIISIAQFRPEKNQILQILAIKDLYNKNKKYFADGWGNRKNKKVQLNIIGSVRNEEDLERYQQLEDKIDEFGLSHIIQLRKNLQFSELKSLLSDSVIGLHSMKMEHFGINVVELLAAGTIPIAHNSGGPKMDIINNQNKEDYDYYGFLADSAEQYSSYIQQVLELYDSDYGQFLENQKLNQKASNYFSAQKISTSLYNYIDPFLSH